MITRILCFIIAALGLSFGGYFTVRQMEASKELIEVKGISEKIVRADVCTVKVKISMEDADSAEQAEKVISENLSIVMNDLKNIGVLGSEMSTDTLVWGRLRDIYENDKKISKFKVDITKTICIETNNVDIPQKIEELIPSWLSKNIVVSSEATYQLADFDKLKRIMLQEASANAKEMAQTFVAPLGEELGDLLYLKQGVISITSAKDAAGEQNGYWYHERSKDKRLKLVVRAGFKKKSHCCRRPMIGSSCPVSSN